MRLLLLLLLLLAATAMSVNAEIRILAEIGEHAIGFPQNWVYWTVEDPAMGRGGHVAFNGVGDISVTSTSNNTPAVWAGLPGAISRILTEFDAIAGLPASVLFRKSISTPIVTRSGHVGLLANLTGAVVFNRTDDALVVHVDGVTKLVLREGVQAPGFPAGVIVNAGSMPFSFTDAGMLVRASTSSAQEGLWFWDFDTTELIAVTGDSAGPDLPGCTMKDFQQFTINEPGVILLRALLQGTGCPGSAVLKLGDGTPRKVVADDDPVPGMAGTVFDLTSDASQINDVGDVTFRARLRRQPASALSLWVARVGGTLELLALEDESLQGMPTELLSSFFSLRAHSVGEARSALIAYTTTTRSILVGDPRASQPYDALEDAGESQLAVLAQEGAQPPGYPATWFFESGDLDPPAIGSDGTVAFSAVVADALDRNGTQTIGIWSGTSAANLKLLAAEGLPFQLGAEQTAITRIFRIVNDSSTQTGSSTQQGDSGQLLFEGERTPGRYAIFLVPEPDGIGALAALATLGALRLARRTRFEPDTDRDSAPGPCFRGAQSLGLLAGFAASG